MKVIYEVKIIYVFPVKLHREVEFSGEKIYPKSAGASYDEWVRDQLGTYSTFYSDILMCTHCR